MGNLQVFKDEIVWGFNSPVIDGDNSDGNTDEKLDTTYACMLNKDKFKDINTASTNMVFSKINPNISGDSIVVSDDPTEEYAGTAYAIADGDTVYIYPDHDNNVIYAPEDSSGLFQYKSAIKRLDLYNLDTSKVTNMSNMFSSMSSLENIDLSRFDTHNVTNMGTMFASCRALKSLDIHYLNTSNVTNISYMMPETNVEYLNMSGLDLSKVSDISNMLSQSTQFKSIDMSNINIGKKPFFKLYNLTYLTDINLHGIKGTPTNMDSSFIEMASIEAIDLSDIDGSELLSMVTTFGNCKNLKSIKFPLDCSKVSSITNINSGCTKLSQIDMSSFSTDTLIKGNIYNTDSSLTPPIGGILNLIVKDSQTAYLLGASSPCSGCFVTPKYISNTSDKIILDKTLINNLLGYISRYYNSITTMSLVITNSKPNLNNYKKSINVSGILLEIDESPLKIQVSNSNNKIAYVSMDLTTNTLYIYPENEGEEIYAPVDSSSLFTGNLSTTLIPMSMNLDALNTNLVTNMSKMFYGNKQTEITLTNFDTENVTDMSYMFCNCEKAENIDISSFVINSNTDISHMFDNIAPSDGECVVLVKDQNTKDLVEAALSETKVSVSVK